MRAAAIAILSLTLHGCATHIGLPQTRDEFVAGMKDGGLFRNSAKATVNRPLKTVVAEGRKYAANCLDVRVTRKLPREGITYTVYRPQVVAVPSGASSLIVQELYAETPDRGMPAGGMYTFVAEMRPEGANATRIDAYYITGRGSIWDWLTPWLEGRSDRCPGLD